MNNLILMAVSAMLVLAGVLALRNAKASRMHIGIALLMAVFSIILLAAYGVATYFTGNGIDEATIYHLKYGLDGAGSFGFSGL